MDRRTILAIVLSFIVLVGYQILVTLYYSPVPTSESSAPPPVATAATETTGETPASSPPGPKPKGAVADVQVGKGDSGPVVKLAGGSPPSPTPGQTTTGAEEKVIPFRNHLVRGEISQTGGRIVELDFLQFLDKLGSEGQPFRFLDKSSGNRFFAESGFLGSAREETPNRETPWTWQGSGTLEGGGSLLLTWDNGQGLLFEKRYELTADSYMIRVTDRVSNRSGKSVDLYHFAQYSRVRPPAKEGGASSTDYEGPMAYLDDSRIQHPYEALVEKDESNMATSGWNAFSDHYFLAALIPEQTQSPRKYYFDYDAPAHRVGYLSDQITLETDKVHEATTQLFIGPKELRNLEAQGLFLERSIDYGWFHFLAVPLVKILLFFYDFFHNYGLAIILLTVAVKIVFFPLANKSYRSMNEMKKLQPKMEQLKKLYGDDKQRLNQEMMKLYQANNVNPLGGCFPILIQIPVFFALYQVLFLSVEMRHAPFILWIDDLSSMDPFYVLPLLMGVSMFIQTKMNPAPADPVQAKIMLFLPVVFTVMFFTFPSGLVLYWLVNNVLSILQQGLIMKRNP
ncbi:MAG: membrane protein insertase YidC [Magnetococcales bacterium]|nr:membrane protein insertase YidC [Magnetococcales bacterium]MBF0155624.1 membrane protein insertase YidC [Magnetococcales bacterium]